MSRKASGNMDNKGTAAYLNAYVTCVAYSRDVQIMYRINTLLFVLFSITFLLGMRQSSTTISALMVLVAIQQWSSSKNHEEATKTAREAYEKITKEDVNE